MIPPNTKTGQLTCRQNFLNAGLAELPIMFWRCWPDAVAPAPVGLALEGGVPTGEVVAEFVELYKAKTDGLLACHIKNTMDEANSASWFMLTDCTP